MLTPDTKSAGNVIGKVRVFVARKNIRLYPWPFEVRTVVHVVVISS